MNNHFNDRNNTFHQNMIKLTVLFGEFSFGKDLDIHENRKIFNEFGF